MGRRYSFKNSKRRWFLDDVRFVHESLPIQFLFVIFLVSLSSRTIIRRYNSDSFLVISSLLQNIIEHPRSSFFHRSTRRFSILRFLFSFFDFARIGHAKFLRCAFHRFINESSASNVPIYHHRSSLSSRAATRLSGSVSYRVGRARPFMPTDFQRRTERTTRARAPTYTTRACAWTKMAVV